MQPMYSTQSMPGGGDQDPQPPQQFKREGEQDISEFEQLTLNPKKSGILDFPVKWRYRGSKCFLVTKADDGGDIEMPVEELKQAMKMLYDEETRIRALSGLGPSLESNETEEDEEAKNVRKDYLGFPVEYLSEDEGSK